MLFNESCSHSSLHNRMNQCNGESHVWDYLNLSFPKSNHRRRGFRPLGFMKSSLSVMVMICFSVHQEEDIWKSMLISMKASKVSSLTSAGKCLLS